MALVLGAGVADTAAAHPGDLVQSFGDGGRAVTALPGRELTIAAGAPRAGGILLAGYSRRAGGHMGRTVLIAYGPGGELDRRFGAGGRVAASGVPTRSAADVAMDGAGRAVVLSEAVTGSGSVISRFTRSGRVDGTFGRAGSVELSFGAGFQSPEAVAIGRDGKIVVGGVLRGEPNHVALARLDPGGGLDRTFGEGGVAVVPSPPGDALSSWTTADLVVRGDGRIAVAYNVTDFVHRARSFGVLQVDSSGGVELGLSYRSNIAGRADTATLTPDGGLLVGGSLGTATGNFVAVARFFPSGRLDPSFGGGDGIATTRFERPFGDYFVASIVRLPSGQIIVAGTSSNFRPSYSRYGLARLTSLGKLDKSFGRHGRVVTRFGKQPVMATAAVPSRRGTVIVAGSGYPNDSRRSAKKAYLARYRLR